MPNIKYYPISSKHKIIQFPPPDSNICNSKEEAESCWGWCEDLVIGEVDIDSPEFIMNDIPDEFKSVIRCIAYEQGHSSGEEEVNMIMRSLVRDFSPAIKTFEERLYRER
jgi:hypothetical protein